MGCISTCGNPKKIMYSRMFSPAEIHKCACKLKCGNSLSRSNFRTWKYTKKLVFPHNFPQFLVYFRTRKCTISCEFPHGEKRISAGVDLHILLCISTFGNSLFKTVQIRIRRNTLFLMWEFTLNCLSPHAVTHQNLCKSTQRI